MKTTSKDIKVLVVSDNHGDPFVLRRAIETESPFDVLIHCGDCEGDLYAGLGPEPRFSIYAVRGNCDRNSLKDQLVTKLGFYRLLITHGHKQQASSSNEGLVRAARKELADIVLFGHTHVPEIATEDGILLINPGSLKRPRQYPRVPTYAVLTISEDELPRAEIRQLPD